MARRSNGRGRDILDLRSRGEGEGTFQCSLSPTSSHSVCGDSVLEDPLHSMTPVPPRGETEPHNGRGPEQCIPCLDNQMTRSTAFRPVRDSVGDSDELVIIPTGAYRALQRSKWVEAMYSAKIQE